MFDRDAIRLGGIAKVQRAISAIVALLEDSEDFPLSVFDAATRLYYVGIHPSEETPALLVVCELDKEDDVRMMHIRERAFSL